MEIYDIVYKLELKAMVKVPIQLKINSKSTFSFAELERKGFKNLMNLEVVCNEIIVIKWILLEFEKNHYGSFRRSIVV